MLAYAIKRFGVAILVAITVSIVTFTLLRLSGDPAAAMAGEAASAEDIEYIDFLGNRRKDDSIGIEVNCYLKYMLYKNLEFAINFGYLFADDALDAFEVGDLKDGSSDEDILVSSSRLRFKF